MVRALALFAAAWALGTCHGGSHPEDTPWDKCTFAPLSLKEISRRLDDLDMLSEKLPARLDPIPGISAQWLAEPRDIPVLVKALFLDIKWAEQELQSLAAELSRYDTPGNISKGKWDAGGVLDTLVLRTRTRHDFFLALGNGLGI